MNTTARRRGGHVFRDKSQGSASRNAKKSPNYDCKGDIACNAPSSRRNHPGGKYGMSPRRGSTGEGADQEPSSLGTDQPLIQGNGHVSAGQWGMKERLTPFGTSGEPRTSKLSRQLTIRKPLRAV